jgi:chitin disaccharide deacetylase
VAHNAALLGVYDFAATNYRALMQGWLREVPREGALLFCHPGLASLAGPPDAIAAARERELAYLESDAFSADLEQAQVALGPVWRLSETSSAD